MPPDKVACGFIVLKVPRLSASISENSVRYIVIVLVRKGVGTETAIFPTYEKQVVIPFATQEQKEIARANDKSEDVPDFLHAVLSTDGRPTER